MWGKMKCFKRPYEQTLYKTIINISRIQTFQMKKNDFTVNMTNDSEQLQDQTSKYILVKMNKLNN
jgi:hypothetical protein